MGERTRRLREVGLRLPTASVVLAGLSCGGGEDITEPTPTPPPAVGTLRVTTVTSGPNPDPNGYAFALDGGPTQAIGINATATLTSVAAGAHSVQLSGIAGTCRVGDTNPRSVTLSGGASAEVSFAITCVATTGTLEVTATTTGPSPDQDGYIVSVDGQNPQPIGVNATLSIPALAAGTHTVTLAGLTANCSVTGDNPRSVTIVAGASAVSAFAVVCPTPSLTHWTTMVSGTTSSLWSISGSSSSNVLAVGSAPTVLQFNGTAWSPQGIQVSSPAVWVNSTTDAFAVGRNTEAHANFLHYDGQRWSEMSGPIEGENTQVYVVIYDIWGSSETDVFAVGNRTADTWGAYILHYDGSVWSRMPVSKDLYSVPFSVSGSSKDNVYAAGFYSPLGGGPDESRAVITHYDGRQWSEVLREPNLILSHVWASPDGHAYATGVTVVSTSSEAEPGVGALWHFDGRRWSALATPTTAPLGAIWGSSSSDFFVLAEDNTVWHFDGVSWKLAHTSATALHDIWGSSPTDVFAVGDGGTILHGTP